MVSGITPTARLAMQFNTSYRAKVHPRWPMDCGVAMMLETWYSRLKRDSHNNYHYLKWMQYDLVGNTNLPNNGGDHIIIWWTSKYDWEYSGDDNAAGVDLDERTSGGSRCLVDDGCKYDDDCNGGSCWYASCDDDCVISSATWLLLHIRIPNREDRLERIPLAII